MKKQDFSKKIIKILANKPAISVEELSTTSAQNPTLTLPLSRDGINSKTKYAITRSIKGLADAGLIEQISSGQSYYTRLTKEGRKKANSLKLEAEESLVSTHWDGYWRIIILDLPEDRKSEREALRYLLKKAGFVCVKNSVWISMYPYEHLFTNIKNDLGLGAELMIIVSSKIDKETEKEFFNLVK